MAVGHQTEVNVTGAISAGLSVTLAKWERHSLGHSPGYLNLSRDRLWFVPHARSILDKGFDVPLASVTRVERSDNLLWRGAVNIYLAQELKIHFQFRVDPKILVSGMEEDVFCSDKLRFFLGWTRKRFLSAVREVGLGIKEWRG